MPSNLHGGPIIRVWGKKGKNDWNEYWRLDRLVRARRELGAELENLGVEEIDICPNLSKPVLASDALIDVEVFLQPLTASQSAVIEAIRRLTGVWAGPSPAADEAALRARVKDHLLYLRQAFELWDEQVPRFVLGLDFDQGLRNFKLCPKDPEQWRLIDHQVDGINCDRRVLPALPLEPTDKGRALLEELDKTFSRWHGAGHNYRMPLNDVLDYRAVLLRYGVDCNEAFRDGLVEGWYPIDIDARLSSKSIRTLCSTPLPDHLADLLAGDLDGGTGRDYIHFEFAALTDN